MASPSLALIGRACALLLLLGMRCADASCSQVSVEGAKPKSGPFSFQADMGGFYQWMNNNGYCGEVCLLQSGLARGQWTSQFNVRSTATPFGGSGGSVTQTGRAEGAGISFYSQLLLDDSAPIGSSKGNSFGQAAANLKLVARAFNSAKQATGLQVR